MIGSVVTMQDMGIIKEVVDPAPSWEVTLNTFYLFRQAALQVSMNDGLSFISSSVIISSTHCVSYLLKCLPHFNHAQV